MHDELVGHSDDGNFTHHVTMELVEVEELPPVWGNEESRREMSKRFKLEGNKKFAAGDYIRCGTEGGWRAWNG